MADPTQLENIDFVSEQERDWFIEAVLGEEVQNFLNSSTGRYLHGRAKGDYDECVRKMFKLDPYTAEGKKEHARLKEKASHAENFVKWIADVIQNGRTAEALIKQNEND
jgi:DNA polymerase elongation subunit (family B)